jgi:nitrogen fixation protein NifB
MSGTRTIERAAHPCFDSSRRSTSARIHLPVAYRCNVQCRYCDRSADCPNENRPGAASAVLEPQRALECLDLARARIPDLSVAGIAGPGDPLASADESLKTLELVRAAHPDLLLCIATNGLELPAFARDLVSLGISHVTVTVNAVDPAVGAGIYAWIRTGGRARSGPRAAGLLWDRQREGILALTAAGVTVKINTVYIPGVNADHVAAVARAVGGLGVSFMNLMPMIPVPGTPLAGRGIPEASAVAAARSAAGEFVAQLGHCGGCRADAAGHIGESASIFDFLPPSRQAPSPSAEGCEAGCGFAGAEGKGCRLRTPMTANEQERRAR